MLVFWLEAEPYDPVASAAQTVRATSGEVSACTLFGGHEWLPVIAELPNLTREVFTGAFKGQIDATYGQLKLASALGDIDDWASLNWSGRPLRLYTAEIDTTDPSAPVYPLAQTLLFEGQTESFKPGLEAATLSFTVALPKGKIASLTYAGTGGLEGNEQIKGVAKPYAAGIHVNHPAQQLDYGLLLYQVHAYGAIESFDGFREAGRPLDQTIVNHATYAALAAAVVPATEIHTCLAEGTFRIGFDPQGDITADFHGAATGGFVSTPGACIEKLLLHVGWPADQVDTTTLDALDVEVPDDIWISDTSGRDVTDELTRIMLACGGYWDVDNLGTFYVGLVRRQTATLAAAPEGPHLYGLTPASLPTYDILELDPQPVRAPFWRNRMAYDHNPRVLNATEIAAADPDTGLGTGGTAANIPVTVYARSYTKPTTLTTEPGVPVGTLLIAPATGLGILWMAQSLQQVDGTVIGSWSDWVALEQYPGYRIVEHPDSSASVTTTLDSIKAGGASVPAGSKTVMAYLDEKITGPQELYFQLAHDFSDDTTKHYLHFGYVKHEGASTVLTNPLAYWAWDFFDGTTADFYEVGIYDGGGYTQGSSGSVIYDNEPFDTDVTYGIIYDGIYMHFTIDGAPIHSSYAGPGLTLHPSAMMETPPDGAINIRYKAGQPREVPIEAIQWIGPLTFLNGTMARYTPGDPGDWYAATFFTERGFAGNAVAQAFVPDADFKGAFGLHAPGPDPLEPYELDHGFEFLGNGTFRIKEDTTVKLGITAYSANDHFRVAYSGTTVTYLKNGSVLDSSTVASGLTFRLSGAIYNHEDRLLNLVFAPAA